MISVRHPTVSALLDELGTSVHDECECNRLVFLALARHHGWNSARIARYMGISRERVRQKIERLSRWADSSGMPTLCRLLNESADTYNATDLPVAFLLEAWRDPEFANGLIDLVAA